MSASQSQIPQSFITKSPPAYEFPKRKRWADLLLTELVDNVVFILSPTGRVWYCGTTVTEILGWRDVDLLDIDFLDLIDAADQERFRIAFAQAVHDNAEFNLAIKLKSNDSGLSFPSSSSSKGVIFEIKCYPHVTTENGAEIKCLFAMAAPYPSRNTAMLNTLLDLKSENNRLQCKVAECRNRVPANALMGQSLLSYSPSSSSFNLASSIQKSVDSHTYIPSTILPTRTFDGTMRNSSLIDATEFSRARGQVNVSASVNVEDPADEGSKKKKLKRSQNTEQYVCITCGRTDSPEWRKGPLGPKTLCNACGLRWAKQMRKAEDPAEGIVGEN